MSEVNIIKIESDDECYIENGFDGNDEIQVENPWLSEQREFTDTTCVWIMEQNVADYLPLEDSELSLEESYSDEYDEAPSLEECLTSSNAANEEMLSSYKTTANIERGIKTMSKINCIYCGFVFEREVDLSIHLKLMHRNHSTINDYLNKMKRNTIEKTCVICKNITQKYTACLFCSRFLCSRCTQLYQENNSKVFKCGVILCTDCSKRKCHVRCERLKLDESLFSSESEHFGKASNLLCFNDKVQSNKPQMKTLAHTCVYCKETFSHLENLSIHLKLMHRGFLSLSKADVNSKDKLKFKCLYCDKIFHEKKYLLAHTTRMHSGGFATKLTGDQVRCHICKRLFSNANNLRNHVQGFHMKPKLICKQCGNRCRSEFTLREHMKACFRKLSSTNTKKNMTSSQNKCVYCNMIFRNSRGIKTHVGHKHRGAATKNHSRPDTTNIAKASLKRVLRSQSDKTLRTNKSFTCARCGKKCKYEFHLRKHTTACLKIFNSTKNKTRM